MEKINFVSEADAFWKNLSNQSDDSQVRRISFQLPSDILTFVILLSYFRSLCLPIQNNPLLIAAVVIFPSVGSITYRIGMWGEKNGFIA